MRSVIFNFPIERSLVRSGEPMQAARQAGALGGSSDGFLTDPASVSPDAVRHHEAHVLPDFPARKCAAPEGPGPQGSFMTDSLLFQVRLERACRVEVDRGRDDTGLAPCGPRSPRPARLIGLSHATPSMSVETVCQCPRACTTAMESRCRPPDAYTHRSDY